MVIILVLSAALAALIIGLWIAFGEEEQGGD